MIRRHQARWLLFAALLLAQALGVAHAFEHPALSHADHACTVCAHGQGLDTVPPTICSVSAQLLTQQDVSAYSPAAFTAVILTGYHSRAPPRFA